MKKILLILSVIMMAQVSKIHAQVNWSEPDTLFYAPDTVCVYQPVFLSSRYANQNSYYWGFCSGYLSNTPTGVNMGHGFDFHHPSAIDVKYDVKSGNYFGFVLNASTTELIRLDFGNNLNNTPTVYDLGNMTKGLPKNPTSLFIVRDTMSGNWYMFVTGGYDATTSTVARIDFGNTLGNPAPNIANFGNLWGSFNHPKGIFVAQDTNKKWYGYLVNYNTNHLIQLEFSYNISNTPAVIRDLGNPGGLLNDPTDMAALFYQGQWYFYVTNAGNSTIGMMAIGGKLDTNSVSALAATNLGNFDYSVLVPSSISINSDCGGIYAYITDSTSNQLVNLEMSTPSGPYYPVDYASIGTPDLPTGISSIIRDYDQIYAFICNEGDSSLTKISLEQCHNSSIPSYNDVTPPPYYYDSPGVYNIYYVINEGLPNVQVQCKPIYVLPKPTASISPTTNICLGDTARLWAISSSADSIRWQNMYNADSTFLQDSLRIWPAYSTIYPVTLYYPHDCIVKDTVDVNVTQISADAGPDRAIHSGASTTLGGPNSSAFGAIGYYWQPYQFMATGDTLLPNPVVTPPYTSTYWVKVTEYLDGKLCTATDTVTVLVVCGDFVLPNVFAPNSPYSGVNKFGIINNEVEGLNYLRIYDRWGLLVYQTTDPTQGWDGTYNGDPEPVGVYVWEADGFCTDGTHLNRKGNVSLVR